jgi:hypothetical protein
MQVGLCESRRKCGSVLDCASWESVILPRFPMAGEYPLALAALADALPASERCLRPAGVMVFRRPLLRLPRADMTADMVALSGVFIVCQYVIGAGIMPSSLAR